MLLPRALLVPHLPTLLEDEHRRHRTPMLEALAREARRFVAERPEIAVVLSGRWESSGPFHVGSGRFHRTLTDDPVFGVEARYDCTGHPELARVLVEAGTAAGIRVGPSERGVDGGVSVPMHFLVPTRALRVVPLSTARRPIEECRRWGAVIRQVLERRPERIGLVVGGMLSRATHAWNFRREVPEAAQLDEAVLAALRAGDWAALGPVVDKWQQRAHPEAGLRHLEVLRGFLGSEPRGEVICYEAGPGVGAALVAFPVPGATSVALPEALEEPAAEVHIGRERAPARRPDDRQPGDRRRDDRPGARKARPERRKPTGRATANRSRSESRAGERGRRPSAAAGTRKRYEGTGAAKRGKFGDGRVRRGKFAGGSSAGSRTPRARGRAPASRPARRPRG